MRLAMIQNHQLSFIFGTSSRTKYTACIEDTRQVLEAVGKYAQNIKLRCIIINNNDDSSEAAATSINKCLHFVFKYCHLTRELELHRYTLKPEISLIISLKILTNL
jgi:hypothetical protein